MNKVINHPPLTKHKFNSIRDEVKFFMINVSDFSSIPTGLAKSHSHKVFKYLAFSNYIHV